jgi:Rieske Fe-S protein
MTRTTARAMLATGVALAGVMSIAVLTAVLTPHEEVRSPIVPIASFDALPQGTPVLLTSKELAGLDAKAERLRSHGSGFGRPRGAVQALPIFVVRDGDDVRAFIGIDPRNGCDVKLFPARTLPWGSFPTMLQEVCHGSIYDFAGQKIGGPSPWNLDELVITVRDGKVFASTTAVIPGRWIAGN